VCIATTDLSETEISFDLWRIWKLMDIGGLHYRHWRIAVKANGDTRENKLWELQNTWTGNVLCDS